MARTGCVSAAAICTCAPARTRCALQVLPAYGLQDLQIERRSLPTQSNPNTMCLPITLGENLGGGHFYLAQIRTFLLCVDTIHRVSISVNNDRHRYGGSWPLSVEPGCFQCNPRRSSPPWFAAPLEISYDSPRRRFGAR